MYVISLVAGVFYTQLMAIITQGTLAKLREKMFDHMQDLPIRYFDTHNHGDIMSFYTNDIDTLRQLISQSLPQLTISCVTLISVFCIMVYYSVWLALVVTCGVIIMFFTARYVSGHSSKLFPAAAGDHRQDRGLYGGNDERPEGRQGLLPRGRRQGRLRQGQRRTV